MIKCYCNNCYNRFFPWEADQREVHFQEEYWGFVRTVTETIDVCPNCGSAAICEYNDDDEEE